MGISEDRLCTYIRPSVDTQAFNPDVEPFDLSALTSRDTTGLPVITYVGKATDVKGIFELVEVLGQINAEFLFLVLSGGPRLADLREAVTRLGLGAKTLFLGFRPPWTMPSIFRASTCVVCPERDFPISIHTPIIGREVMATGTCLVLSEELYAKRASPKITAGESVLTINPKDYESFRNTLAEIIKNPTYAKRIGVAARQVSEELENFDGYVNGVEMLYEEILNSSQIVSA